MRFYVRVRLPRSELLSVKRFMGRGCGSVSQTTSVDRFRPRICFLDISYDMDSVVCDKSVVLIDGSGDGSNSPAAAALPDLVFKLQSSVSILADHLHRLVGLIASESPSDAVEKVMDKLRSLVCLVGSGVCVPPVDCIFRVDGNYSGIDNFSSGRNDGGNDDARNFDVNNNNENVVGGCGRDENGKRGLVRKNDVDEIDDRGCRWSNPSRPRSRHFPLRFDLNCLKSCAKVCCARHLFDVLVDENVVLAYRQANHVFSRVDGFYALPAETVCSVFRERVRDLYRRYCGVLSCDETTGCSARIDDADSAGLRKFDQTRLGSRADVSTGRVSSSPAYVVASPLSPIPSSPSSPVSYFPYASYASSSSSSPSSSPRRGARCPSNPRSPSPSDLVLRPERFVERARWHPWSEERRTRDGSSSRRRRSNSSRATTVVVSSPRC